VGAPAQERVATRRPRLLKPGPSHLYSTPTAFLPRSLSPYRPGWGLVTQPCFLRQFINAVLSASRLLGSPTRSSSPTISSKLLSPPARKDSTLGATESFRSPMINGSSTSTAGLWSASEERAESDARPATMLVM